MRSRPLLRRLLFALLAGLLVLAVAEGAARLVWGAPSQRSLFALWGGQVGQADTLRLFAGAVTGRGMAQVKPRDPTLSWFVAEAHGPGRTLYTRRPTHLMSRNVDPRGIEVPAPSGVKRVFVLGGSSAYGVPGAPDQAFSDQLGPLLEARAPGAWQVLNVANPGLDSYDIRGIVDETAAMQPRLYVLYEGHNDCGNAWVEGRYLVRQSPRVVNLDILLWNHLRLYGLLRATLDPWKQRLAEDPAQDSPGVVAERRRVRETQRALVEQGWRENLRAMVARARAAQAGFVFVLPSSNLYHRPGGSVHYAALSAEERTRFDAALAEARAGRASLDTLRAAAALDPGYAELAWALGRAELAAGNLEEGRRWLVAAKEADVVSARAWESVVRAMQEEAEALGVPVVDSRALLAGPDGLPAEGFFEDNLHLTPPAHARIAEALVPVVEAEGG